MENTERSVLPQDSHDATKLYTALVFFCEDARDGIAPTLASFLHGDLSLSKAMETITRALRDIDQLSEHENAKYAFTLHDGSSSLHSSSDRPRQRLEWLLLVNILPLLAMSSFASIHRDLVTKVLQTIHTTLVAADDDVDSQKPALPSRCTWSLCSSILKTMQTVVSLLQDKDQTFPCECPVRMSSFKAPSNGDPVWMTLRFSAVEDAVTFLCFLISFLCPRVKSTAWSSHGIDQGLKLQLVMIVRTVLHIFQPSPRLPNRLPETTRALSLDRTVAETLYQACAFCVLDIVPQLYSEWELISDLSESFMLILYQHVMTVQDRCLQWHAAASSRIELVKVKSEPSELNPSLLHDPESFSLKDSRREQSAMIFLESLLVKSLAVSVEKLEDPATDGDDWSDVGLLAFSLMSSKQLQALSVDESGMNIQCVVLRIVNYALSTSQISDPLGTIECVLDHYIHMDTNTLVQLIHAILYHAQGQDTETLPSSTSSMSAKRSIEESDQTTQSSIGGDGKRVKRDTPNTSQTSTADCSSIVYPSQPSQRQDKSVSSSSFLILKLFKKFVSAQAGGYTGSQVSRGIQPPLSVGNIRCAIVLVQLWAALLPRRSHPSVDQDAEQLGGHIENLVKSYLLWAFSPGMQNQQLNQKYLEKSFPLMLDLVASLAQINLGETVNDFLICLASAPWFPTLRSPRLWAFTGQSMEVEGDQGCSEIVRVLLEVLEGSEILTRLKSNPTLLLEPCRSFSQEEFRAVRIMSTFPRSPRLHVWRTELIKGMLATQRTKSAPDVNDSQKRIAALESLAVMSTHCMNERTVIDCLASSLSSLVEDEGQRITLAHCLGTIACGLCSSSDRSRFVYDPTAQSLTQVRSCVACGDGRIFPHSSAERIPGEKKAYVLGPAFLNHFNRLIPTCTSAESSLTLLQSLQCIFCHLDLASIDLRALGFGQYLLAQLTDQEKSNRFTAGNIVELIAIKAEIALCNRPLQGCELDGCLARVDGAIGKGLVSTKSPATRDSLLQLAGRIMIRLPEDHPTFASLLLKMLDQASGSSPSVSQRRALDQLSIVASKKNLSRYRLLQPQSEYVGSMIVEKLVNGQDRWLHRFYSWTGLPHPKIVAKYAPQIVSRLIIGGREDLIGKVAAILGWSVASLCINMVDAILARAYMQDQEGATHTLSFLGTLSIQKGQDGGGKLENLGAVKLATLSTQGLLCHISLDLGHIDAKIRDKATSVINFVAELFWQGQQSELGRRDTSRERPPLSVFLRGFILGILSEVNNTVRQPDSDVSLGTRAKYLRSLEGLVRLLQPIQRSVLSQIFSPLRTAIQIKELRLQALTVLESIVRAVDPLRLDVLLAHIAHSLGKVFDESTEQEREVEVRILRFLIVESKGVIGAILPDIGALPPRNAFVELNELIATQKGKPGVGVQIRRLIDRIQNEHMGLAEQSLSELRDWLCENEMLVMDMASQPSDDGEGMQSILGDLVQALLAGIGRCRGLDVPISRLCAECLGIIGAVDPAKLGHQRPTVTTPVYVNFDDTEDSRNFVCSLIQNQLVGPTRSAVDFTSEDQLALTLQTLLSFCGITSEVLQASDRPTEGITTRVALSQRLLSQSSVSSSMAGAMPLRRIAQSPRDRWEAFPRHVQEVLELFIDAKYRKKTSVGLTETPHPLYPKVKTYKEWLVLWTRDLISKVVSPNAKEIFQACRSAISYDSRTCSYILPHLVLNILMKGREKDREDIITEMVTVLCDGGDVNHLGAEQLFAQLDAHPSEMHQLGSQAVFAVFDHISKWIQYHNNLRSPSSQTASIQPRAPDAMMVRMQTALTSISHNIIALASLRCKAYARALSHYEQCIRDAKLDPKLDRRVLQEMYEKLQEIYVNVEEPDGMEGISGLITSGSLNQSLLKCESAGRWDEALAYYEFGLQSKPDRLEYHVGLFNSLENLGQFDTTLTAVEGDIASNPSWEQELNDSRIISAWKAQQWDGLEKSLSRSLRPTFEGGVGQLLLDMRHDRVHEFEAHLQQVRSMLIAPLAAASMESYSRAYDCIVQLHMLHEIEVASKSWNEARQGERNGVFVDRLKQYSVRLDQRYEAMAPSFRVREKVTSLRRLVFYDIRMKQAHSSKDLAYLQEECGRLWLRSARDARHAGNSHVSFRSLLQAEALKNRSAIIERVKWGFAHQREREAIQAINTTLESALLPSRIVPEVPLIASLRSAAASSKLRTATSLSVHRIPMVTVDLSKVQDFAIDTKDPGFIRAKAILLRTRWMDHSNLVSPSEIIEGYRQTTAECERWEKGYYFLGQFYFKLFEGSRRSKIRAPVYTYATQGCRFYGKALTLGPKYLYQILPRLLTFWLDLGQKILPQNPPVEPTLLVGAATEFATINSLMQELGNLLPAYMFLSAFPQIISRICHRNVDAFTILQGIIVNVVVAFPDQAIWQMVSVSKSIVPERSRVCNAILDCLPRMRTLGALIFEQVREALDFCVSLIALSMYPIGEKITRVSLEKSLPKIALALRSRHNVTIPCQATLWPLLPASSKTMASHHAFKPNLPKVLQLVDEIEIMSSLQKPRKIAIVGTDGKRYTFLCKPKDDLRKDAKVMEFNNLVNMLLKKNREANRRDLYIRTYAVVPLNEECGLIEWVQRTVPFRHIMQKLYKLSQKNLLSIQEIKRILDDKDHVRLFVNELLPRFPPIFYQWFKDISPEPTAWLATRLRYTRTTAVMSMVGHILGLGDRHGENLLFDERNGDIVHVDFNCLFEQGKTFPKPERVPFRLTHNMVDAMGLPGYDGVYRLTCEITLKVFRENIESLTSVLEGFLHDPLVEWSKKKSRLGQPDPLVSAAVRGAENGEDGAGIARTADGIGAGGDGGAFDSAQNEKAQQILLQIRRKLLGGEFTSGFPLSVQGQAEELIQVATDSENLARMYIGWSPYL